MSKLPSGSSRTLLSALAATTLFGLSQGIVSLWPDLKLPLFCRPAAALAAAFLRVPSLETTTGFLLIHSRLDIHVVEACSGYDFFSILLAVLVFQAARIGSRPLLGTALVLPVAYAITIAANTARIVSSAHARVLADHLPGLSLDAAHVAAGTVIFLCALCLAVLATRFVYEKA